MERPGTRVTNCFSFGCLALLSRTSVILINWEREADSALAQLSLGFQFTSEWVRDETTMNGAE